MNKKLKLCSWNILAPELLSYFWRSSYGLEISNPPNSNNFFPPNYYTNITQIRIDNIMKYLHDGNFDIICLQEVTDKKYLIINGLLVVSTDDTGFTLYELIAKTLKMNVVSVSFKQKKFNSGIPPTEQHKDKSVSSILSGVATLAKPDLNITNITKAEIFVGATSNESPLTIDKLILPYYDVPIYIINVHIKMEYPNIKKSIDDLYEIIGGLLLVNNIRSTILVGDFNAHDKIAATDLKNSTLHDNMFDIFKEQYVDDHIFIGRDIYDYENDAILDETVKLLKMGANKPSTGPNYINPGSSYNKLSSNQQLIKDMIVTTDHPPIIANIYFANKKKK